jgi:hypothetical protein
MSEILSHSLVDTLTHPEWCEPQQCEADQEFGYHRSAPHEVCGALIGDITLSVQLKCSAYDPLHEAQVSIDLAINRFGEAAGEEYHLDDRIVRQLTSILDTLLPVLSSSTRPG